MKLKHLGSKKKNRRAEYNERKLKRFRERTRQERIKNATTMEEMANAMGIKLQ